VVPPGRLWVVPPVVVQAALPVAPRRPPLPGPLQVLAVAQRAPARVRLRLGSPGHPRLHQRR